jgi:hypothetical protein
VTTRWPADATKGLTRRRTLRQNTSHLRLSRVAMYSEQRLFTTEG